MFSVQPPQQVIVIGAGIVGVSTAYELALRGVGVTLIDMREGAGLGTSFANGGQLSACEVAPWAGPEIPGLILKWLGRDDAPFRLRPKMDPDQWLWLMRFLARCRSSARRERIPHNLELALLTRARLAAYREQFAAAGEALEFEQREKGILRIFRDRHSLADAVEETKLMARLGVEQEPLTPAQCIDIEPALGPAMQRGDIAGGLYSRTDSSGDAHLYSVALAAAAQRLGVRFMKTSRADSILTDGGWARGVTTAEGEVEGDAVVVAAGAGSAALLKPLGLRSYIYPLKGYSVTLPAPAGNAPEVSITDEERKIVISRLGNRLRAAGQAEVGGYDLTLERPRAEAVLSALVSLFPQAGPEREAAEFWCGLRPMTPDGSPVIGATPGFANIFINSGHGTLGWTLGAGSGAALAELICGGASQPDLSPFSIRRFQGFTGISG
ncbi:FAD dependent oxidoreductase [Parvibaculum lavamentivorans DS-1]|uniref:FAD dependent oxidoreductase n=1 Tax=Parvibaculum lavamentivorans (strain DS-1 / DSM 13023 / NCIMB 13966) TaxID=402881 RepID=A7HRH6_PARL1|nr:FAD dependent oxidoreductase [Parvibaculum lavamentivorans DS-1]